MKIEPLSKPMFDLSGANQILPTCDNLDLLFDKINDVIERLNPKESAAIKVLTRDDVVYRKIPILITKYEDEDKGWRAEIADNWESYKPTEHSKINFEDLGFHFRCVDTFPDQHDPYVFKRKKDAVAAAKEVVKLLYNKAKIWHI